MDSILIPLIPLHLLIPISILDMSTEPLAAVYSAQARANEYVPAVGPRLKRLLLVVFALVALLGANSAYLAGITALEWLRGETYQNFFYQCMFLGHLVLGLLLIVPF